MGKEKISIEELLTRQGGLRRRATIKLDSDDRVTVTPVVAGGGCACAQAVVVDKADIEGVVLTDEVHDCCGERLSVVEVTFVNETVTDIFRQLSEAAARRSQSRPIPTAAQTRPAFRDCGLNYQYCTESCGWWASSELDYQLCANRCHQTYKACAG
jgi:hypothetical protein